jgi:hypothetical protein
MEYSQEDRISAAALDNMVEKPRLVEQLTDDQLHEALAALEWMNEHHMRRREIQREWQRRNPEKVRESQKKWRDGNREHVREVERRRRAANPEQARSRQARWRARCAAKIDPPMMTLDDVNFNGMMDFNLYPITNRLTTMNIS